MNWKELPHCPTQVFEVSDRGIYVRLTKTIHKDKWHVDMTFRLPRSISGESYDEGEVHRHIEIRDDEIASAKERAENLVKALRRDLVAVLMGDT